MTQRPGEEGHSQNRQVGHDETGLKQLIRLHHQHPKGRGGGARGEVEGAIEIHPAHGEDGNQHRPQGRRAPFRELPVENQHQKYPHRNLPILPLPSQGV